MQIDAYVSNAKNRIEDLRSLVFRVYYERPMVIDSLNLKLRQIARFSSNVILDEMSTVKCSLLSGFFKIIFNKEMSFSRGGSRGGPGPPRPPKMRPQHQNSTKLRPQNGSFRPVTIWAPPLIKSWIHPCFSNNIKFFNKEIGRFFF